ncbi:MAG: GTPase domain-containing protein, partial [Gemmataceae bacterium]
MNHNVIEKSNSPMDMISKQQLITRLAEDFNWLEQFAHKKGFPSSRIANIRLAGALVRNCIGPFLNKQESIPLHAAVVGGAGAGKSTTVNMIIGQQLAESNPQAGFTRHPIAFYNATENLSWTAPVGFLGPLSRLSTSQLSSLDEDVYQIRRYTSDETSGDLLKNWVIWDCPDMTTWESEGYISRLIEAAALADLIVYAASDERYNDEIPTQFIHLLLSCGKPVICCLLKMREEDSQDLVEHFRREIIAPLPPDHQKAILNIFPIPFLPADALKDLGRNAGRWRIPLVNQVAALGNSTLDSRKRAVKGAIRFLKEQQAALLSVTEPELEALKSWKNLVLKGQEEFDKCYAQEYLATEKYRGFDEALIRLIDLLDFPGFGQIFAKGLYIVRTPFRWAEGFFEKTFTRPTTTTRSKKTVLQEALGFWLDYLHVETGRRITENSIWKHIHEGFQNKTLARESEEKFQSLFVDFESKEREEIEKTAQSIFERLNEKPLLLNTLRT